MDASKASKWYIIFVKTGDELLITNKLNQRFSNMENVEFFCPQRILKIRRKGTVLTEKQILFPSYIFVQTIINQDIYNYTNKIEGVNYWLGDETGPISLYDEEVIKLKQILNRNHIVDLSKGMIVGQKVKIIEGPLKNFTGKIESVDKRKQRAKIKIIMSGLEKYINLGLEIVG